MKVFLGLILFLGIVILTHLYNSSARERDRINNQFIKAAGQWLDEYEAQVIPQAKYSADEIGAKGRWRWYLDTKVAVPDRLGEDFGFFIVKEIDFVNDIIYYAYPVYISVSEGDTIYTDYLGFKFEITQEDLENWDELAVKQNYAARGYSELVPLLEKFN